MGQSYNSLSTLAKGLAYVDFISADRGDRFWADVDKDNDLIFNSSGTLISGWKEFIDQRNPIDGGIFWNSNMDVPKADYSYLVPIIIVVAIVFGLIYFKKKKKTK